MKVNNQMMPGAAAAGGLDQQKLVDQIMQPEKALIGQKEARRDRVVAEKNEYSSIDGMLGDLGSLADGLKDAKRFTALAFESSHPDIFDGTVSGFAEPGRFEIEVDQLASPDRFLDVGFPSPDSDGLGFGHMAIEGADGAMRELTIEPGTSLRDVASQINDSGLGVKAMIVNTGAAENPFKLMVSSEKTGEAAKIHIDPDTTFLETDHIRKAGDLKLKFEDIDVQRPNNDFKDLLEGVEFSAKKAAPGTKVAVEIKHDPEKTVANITDFVGKYNALANHINQKFQAPAPGQQQPQEMRGDSNMRSIMRSLQGEVAKTGSSTGGTAFRSLSEIGITTNAKTGELVVDEQKLKGALSKDYDGVRDLFVSSEKGVGLAERVENVVKGFKDPMNGAVANRMKSLDQRIRTQDQEIERQNERLAEKEAQMKQKLANMQEKISQMNSQGAILSARLGGGEAQ